MNNLLPDFNELLELTEEIKAEHMKIILKDMEIKADVANTYHIVTTDNNYFLNGKPMPANRFEKTYEQVGIDGKLIEKRRELAELKVTVKYLENKLSIFKEMINVWRTLSANERKLS